MNKDLLQAAALVIFAAFILNRAWKHKEAEVADSRLDSQHSHLAPQDRVKAMGLMPERVVLTFDSDRSIEATFVKHIAELAIQESARLDGKIPASLIVAQAILESNYGKSRLAKKANNYFGHKWRGKGGWILVNDDAPNERFTKYESRWHSMRAHTNLLMSDLYYGRLKGKPNLENWLDALCGSDNSVESKKFVKRGGRVYATACYNSCYACKLRAVVDKWKLKQLDI
jgi:flagellum-specific peptidoglycan hydrolase FlgJ